MNVTSFSHPLGRVDGHGHVGTVGDRPAPPATVTNRFTRPVIRQFTLQQHTGRPVSTVAAGRWDRGVLFRAPSFAVQLPPYNYMIDPTARPDA